MWYMGFSQAKELQRTIEVSFTNITQLLEHEQVRRGGGACPAAPLPTPADSC
jgi:hypothetical protein